MSNLCPPFILCINKRVRDDQFPKGRLLFTFFYTIGEGYKLENSQY